MPQRRKCTRDDCPQLVTIKGALICGTHYRLKRKAEAASDPSWPTCEVSYCEDKTRSRTGPHCQRHEQRLRLSGTLATTRHTLLRRDPERMTGFCEKCCREVPIIKTYDGGSGGREDRRRTQIFRCAFSNRDTQLRTAYGISLAEHTELVAASDGRCAICGDEPFLRHGKRMLHIDHDHQTGQVRGLLCQPCNLALGLIRDRPEVARALADYLDRTRSDGPHGAAVRDRKDSSGTEESSDDLNPFAGADAAV